MTTATHQQLELEELPRQILKANGDLVFLVSFPRPDYKANVREWVKYAVHAGIAQYSIKEEMQTGIVLGVQKHLKFGGTPVQDGQENKEHTELPVEKFSFCSRIFRGPPPRLVDVYVKNLPYFEECELVKSMSFHMFHSEGGQISYRNFGSVEKYAHQEVKQFSTVRLDGDVLSLQFFGKDKVHDISRLLVN